MSAPLTDAPRGPVTVPETLPVEGSWAKASDEITRRTVIAPVHRIDCLKVERAQPVLLDILLAYLPCNGKPAISDLIRLSQENLSRQPAASVGRTLLSAAFEFSLLLLLSFNLTAFTPPLP